MMVKRYGFISSVDNRSMDECTDGDYVSYFIYKHLEKQLEYLKEKLRWIPVTERLPEQHSWVMVKEDSAIAMCWFKDGVFTDAYNSGYMFNVNIDKIDRWREIPELRDGE
jgi:hypothetical protein